MKIFEIVCTIPMYLQIFGLAPDSTKNTVIAPVVLKQVMLPSVSCKAMGFVPYGHREFVRSTNPNVKCDVLYFKSMKHLNNTQWLNKIHLECADSNDGASLVQLKVDL